jgi:hypothetical protein
MTWKGKDGSRWKRRGAYPEEVGSFGQGLGVVVVQVTDDRRLGAVDLQLEGQEKGELHLPARARP